MCSQGPIDSKREEGMYWQKSQISARNSNTIIIIIQVDSRLSEWTGTEPCPDTVVSEMSRCMNHILLLLYYIAEVFICLRN